MLALVVHTLFADHAVGELIVDAGKIAEIIGTELEKYVTKVSLPVPPAAAPSAG